MLIALTSVVSWSTMWAGDAPDPLLPPPLVPNTTPKVEPLTPRPPVQRPIIKPAAPIQLPVPDTELLDAALKSIKDTYKNEYRARRTEEKIAFAQSLIEAGSVKDNKLEERVVLLREAGNIAAKIGDVETAEISVKSLVKYFSVNEHEEYARVYETLIANIPNTEVGQRLAIALVGLIENCITDDEHDLAQRLAKSGETLGRRIRDNGVVARAKSLGAKSKNLAAELKTIEEHQDLLGNYTPEGHRRYGLFLCTGKNDWTNGIIHLAKGDDQALKELAVLDFVGQASLEKNTNVGETAHAAAEKFYELALSQSRGNPRESFQARSLLWYRRSLNHLEGLDRGKCERRIDELNKLLANTPFKSSSIFPPGAALLMTFEPETLVVNGSNIIGVLDSSTNGIRATASGVKLIRGAFGTALEFDGTGRIDCGNPKQLQIADNLTISLWLWTQALDLRRNPINKSYGAEGTFTLEPSGSLSYFYGLTTTSGDYTSTSLSPIPVKTWVHLSLVRDFTTKKITSFINGKQTSSRIMTYSRTSISESPLIIGDGYTNPFIGKLDDICYWPRALSPEEIAALYQATSLGR